MSHDPHRPGPDRLGPDRTGPRPTSPHHPGQRRVDRHANELPPHELQGDYRDEIRAGAGAAILLGVLLIVAIGGFVFYFAGAGNRSATVNDMRPPITQPSSNGSAAEPEVTGSSGNMPLATPREPRTELPQ